MFGTFMNSIRSSKLQRLLTDPSEQQSIEHMSQVNTVQPKFLEPASLITAGLRVKR